MIDGYLLRARGKSALCFRVELPNNLDATDCAWVCVVPREGEWMSRKIRGKPLQISRETIATMVKNFEKRSTPIKVDYEHASENRDVYARGDAIPSAGHVLRLETRDGEHGAQLWAYVRFTSRAAGMIRAREYQYNSPVIDFGAVDPVTDEPQGPTLTSMGLTDDPFFQGQDPIRMAFTARNDMDEEMVKQATSDEGSPEEGAATAESLVEAIAASAGISTDEALGKLMAMADELGKALSAQADQEEEQQMSRTTERQLRLREAAISAKLKQIEEHAAKLEAARRQSEEKERAEFSARVQSKADELIRLGHCPDELRSDLVEELTTGFDRTVKLMMSSRHVPAIVDQATTTVIDAKDPLAVLTDQERIVARNLRATGIFKTDQQAAERMLARRR